MWQTEVDGISLVLRSRATRLPDGWMWEMGTREKTVMTSSCGLKQLITWWCYWLSWERLGKQSLEGVREIKRSFYPGEVQGTYYTCKRCYQVDRSYISMRLELRRKVWDINWEVISIRMAFKVTELDDISYGECTEKLRPQAKPCTSRVAIWYWGGASREDF